MVSIYIHSATLYLDIVYAEWIGPHFLLHKNQGATWHVILLVTISTKIKLDIIFTPRKWSQTYHRTTLRHVPCRTTLSLLENAHDVAGKTKRKDGDRNISRKKMQRHNEREIIHHSQGHLAKILQIGQSTYLVSDDPPLNTWNTTSKGPWDSTLLVTILD